MSIQPQESIALRFQVKVPGLEMKLQDVEMHFNYEEAFGVSTRDAYETLLWDIMQNDATLAIRSDQIEAAWTLLTPVLDYWRNTPDAPLYSYPPGSWGPKEANCP
jgi:glucose-6-phosphate 1-dehydrogenase